MCRQRVDNHLGQGDGPVAGLRFRWYQRGCLSLHGDELSVHRHYALKETHPGRRTGFHALRHYYASLLIRHGDSVKTVQSRLGHTSAVETLDTYSHLWPDSDDRTRDAIDSVLGAKSTADALRTESSPD